MSADMTASLVACKCIGEKKLTDLVKERLNTSTKSFWEPLHHLKIRTFATMSARKVMIADKTITVKADRDLFGHHVVVASTRQGICVL